MNGRSDQDRVALGLLVIVGVFIIGSLVAVVGLAFAGYPSGANVWAGLFTMVTATVGVIGGYIAGSAINRRNGK